MAALQLRPRPSEQLDPANEPDKLQLWDNAITPRAKAWNIDMKLPNVSPHPYTDLAHQGFLYARDMGKGADYNQRVFNAFYQEDKNIGEIDVLAKLAAEAGLDEAEFKEALVSGKYQKAHKQVLKHAYEEAQITSIPTFLIGEERIEGAASKEVFEQVIESELKKIKF